MSLKSEDPNYYAHQYNWMDQTGQDKKKIRILDSTLREGEQHPGVSFTIKQRIQIAWMLDSFGVDQIEISPVVSPDDIQARSPGRHHGAYSGDKVGYRHCNRLRRDLDCNLHGDFRHSPIGKAKDNP